MSEAFQRLLTMSGPDALSLNEQAALGPVHAPERSQFAHLVRLFLERFFNHETASPDGDAKGRLVLIAVAAGLPPLIVAMYLWPVYHPFIGWPPGQHPAAPPSYWTQVNHHFFFVMYSFVAMGLVTVFEWDLFFPDLLDVFVLGSLPVSGRRVFIARLGAIAVFILGFLFDANVLAPVVLPMATDPPNLLRFVAGDVVAVAAGGLFAAAFVLALQAVLLALLGERLFRRISLSIQGLSVTVLVVLMLLFPVLSGVTPGLLQSGNRMVQWFPPFWFLGMDQRILEGPAALPVFAELARTGAAATLITMLVALMSYPIAYMRRARALVEGASARSMRNPIAGPLYGILHATLVRPTVRRAVFHFIGQTLFRVPRYRIYLVLYGGVGLSVVAASVLRFSIVGAHLQVSFSADGIRVAIGIVAFWVIAGMRAAFVSSGNRQGSWAMGIVHGQPPHFEAAIERLLAAKVWVALCAATVTLLSFGLLRLLAPPELLGWRTTCSQLLVAMAMCLLLTDAFFLNVTAVPFTGAAREQSNLAFTVLKYFSTFPFIAPLSIGAQFWIERSGRNFGIAAAVIVVVHVWLRKRHRDAVRLHSEQIELEDDEEEFPMRLGLRY
ncbi:MAG TPA: hypothetical protein VGL00_16710 [Terracidiphilus sp.]